MKNVIAMLLAVVLLAGCGLSDEERALNERKEKASLKKLIIDYCGTGAGADVNELTMVGDEDWYDDIDFMYRCMAWGGEIYGFSEEEIESISVEEIWFYADHMRASRYLESNVYFQDEN